MYLLLIWPKGPFYILSIVNFNDFHMLLRWSSVRSNSIYALTRHLTLQTSWMWTCDKRDYALYEWNNHEYEERWQNLLPLVPVLFLKDQNVKEICWRICVVYREDAITERVLLSRYRTGSFSVQNVPHIGLTTEINSDKLTEIVDSDLSLYEQDGRKNYPDIQIDCWSLFASIWLSQESRCLGPT